MRLGDEGFIVARLAATVNMLYDGAVDVGRKGQFLFLANGQLDAQPFGPRLDNVDGLRVEAFGNEERARIGLLLFAAARVIEHHHGFSGRRRLIQQRSVGERHARQVGDHRLEYHQGLQTAL